MQAQNVTCHFDHWLAYLTIHYMQICPVIGVNGLFWHRIGRGLSMGVEDIHRPQSQALNCAKLIRFNVWEQQKLNAQHRLWAGTAALWAGDFSVWKSDRRHAKFQVDALDLSIALQVGRAQFLWISYAEWFYRDDCFGTDLEYALIHPVDGRSGYL